MFGVHVELGTSLSSWSSSGVRSDESASYTARIQSSVNSASTNHALLVW